MVEDVVRKMIRSYPEIRPHLTGYAAVIASVDEMKLGEAPDDEQRIRDERKLQRIVKLYFADQMERILKSAQDMR